MCARAKSRIRYTCARAAPVPRRFTMALMLPMAALSLSAAAPRRAAAQPARLAGAAAAVRLSARRSDALSAGSVALRRPAAVPVVAARAVPTEAKLKSRKSAAKRYKVTGSGKVRSPPRLPWPSQPARSPLASSGGPRAWPALRAVRATCDGLLGLGLGVSGSQQSGLCAAAGRVRRSRLRRAAGLACCRALAGRLWPAVPPASHAPRRLVARALAHACFARRAAGAPPRDEGALAVEEVAEAQALPQRRGRC